MPTQIEDSTFLLAVKLNSEKPILELVSALGYQDIDSLEHGPNAFYARLLNLLGFPASLHDPSSRVASYLFEKGGGFGPILNRGQDLLTIVGHTELRIAPNARDYDWGADWGDDWQARWEAVNRDEDFEDSGYDAPYEVHSSLSSGGWDSFGSLNSALCAYNGGFPDLFRFGFDKLDDDAEGLNLNNFVLSHEKHPSVYFELAHDILH